MTYRPARWVQLLCHIVSIPYRAGEPRRGLGSAHAYAVTVSAFLRVVLEDPACWRLILSVSDSAPRAYRDSLRHARSSILAQAEQLASSLPPG